MRRSFAGQAFVAVSVAPEAWAKRYDIEPFTRECSTCGTMLSTTIPIASRALRGLSAPTCECGNERTPFCVVAAPGHGDLFDALKRPA